MPHPHTSCSYFKISEKSDHYFCHRLNTVGTVNEVIVGLEQTEHMSFLTGQVLPDRTKSGLRFLNILLQKNTKKNHEKKIEKKILKNFFGFFLY